MSSTLVIGFDSAWTTGNKGGFVGSIVSEDGALVRCWAPVVVGFDEVPPLIEHWRETCERVLVMIDQPTIVNNSTKRRPTEDIVCSVIGKAKGGVQPASRARVDMFGDDAPIWQFLRSFNGSLDPTTVAPRMVIETYPALALLGLGWDIDGDLPKYNPERATFKRAHWTYLCEKLQADFVRFGHALHAAWCMEQAHLYDGYKPKKHDQDRLDAMICLRVGLGWIRGEPTIMVGQLASGIMVIPNHADLRVRLRPRLDKPPRVEADWIRDVSRPPQAVISQA